MMPVWVAAILYVVVSVVIVAVCGRISNRRW